MVPVSWPPCPGSITILPIFRPNARIRDRSPSAVGRASRTSTSAIAEDFCPADEGFRRERLTTVVRVAETLASFASDFAFDSSPVPLGEADLLQRPLLLSGF